MLSFNSSSLQSRKCPILARISSYSEYKFIKASAGHRIRFTSHSIRSTDAIWTFVQFYRTDEFSWTNRHQEVHMCNEAIINEYMLCAHRKRLLLYRSNVSFCKNIAHCCNFGTLDMDTGRNKWMSLHTFRLNHWMSIEV